MPYARYTRADLRRQLRDRWDGSPFWTEADANQAINDALLTWNALTGYWRGRISITIPANDPYASVPSTLTQSTSVSIGGVPLVHGSLVGLGALRPNWRRETIATGNGVPTVPTIWVPVSLMQFVIWPMGTSTLTASVDGVRVTPRLTADDATVDVDDSVLSAVITYSLHLAAFKAPAALLQRTQTYKDDFLLAAADRNSALRVTDWYRRIQRTRRQLHQQAMKVLATDGTGGPGGA